MSTPAAAPHSAPNRSATTTPATFRTFVAPPAPPVEALPDSAQSLDAALPPPQIFDILPALHELLSRLLAPGVAPSPALATNGDASAALAQPQAQVQTNDQPQLDTQSQSISQPDTVAAAASQSQAAQQTMVPASQPHSQLNGTSQAQMSTQLQAHTGQYTTLQPTYPNQTPLSIQHLAAEVSTIRNMIRRAREAVGALPDIERSVEEQQEEIEFLKGEMARLKGVLLGLGVQEEAETG